MKGNYRLRRGTEVALPKRIDDWSLTGRQQRLVKTGGRLIKHAPYDCQCQWDEAATLTGADLVKKEVAGGVVVKIYSVAVSARVSLTPMAFATVRPGKPPCPGRTAGRDAAPLIFATRRITPESTVSPTREMVWK
jgi:hypothetical protein